MRSNHRTKSVPAAIRRADTRTLSTSFRTTCRIRFVKSAPGVSPTVWPRQITASYSTIQMSLLSGDSPRTSSKESLFEHRLILHGKRQRGNAIATTLVSFTAILQLKKRMPQTGKLWRKCSTPPWRLLRRRGRNTPRATFQPILQSSNSSVDTARRSHTKSTRRRIHWTPKQFSLKSLVTRQRLGREPDGPQRYAARQAEVRD